jgi:hypothetical protein
MGKIKCFDIAEMVIDEATKQFKHLAILDNDRVDILKDYCDAIDNLSDEFDGTEINVSVDSINGFVIITLTCEEIIIERISHMFYELVERTVSLKFYETNNGKLNVEFTFPSLWKKI